MQRRISILVLVMLVAGCSVNPTPAPTALVSTLAPTATLPPTLAASPTVAPTLTSTPAPTFTPLPTQTAMPTATATSAPTATPTPVTHVVQPGDTLNAIADKYNVSLETLIAANAIQNADLVEAGQTLVIPISGTLAASETPSVTVTPRPVVRVAQPTQALAIPSGYAYPAPKLLRPVNGVNFQFNARSRNGGTDSVTFEWSSVGKLENGTLECRWPGLPNGDIGLMYDRYQIEFSPPLSVVDGKTQAIFNNDHGLVKSFNLLEFKWGITYTWRVVVGRWCVAKFDKKAKHGSLGQVSPYSEPMTFSYSY